MLNIPAWRKGAIVLFSCALLGTMASIASARTFNQILQSGYIRIGVLTGVPPFGSINMNGNTVGSDPATARLLAKDLGVKLKLVALTPPARIPALLSGKVDVLVATLSPTPARAKKVMFSITYNALEQVIVAAKSANYHNLKGLVGKKIAVPRGSPQDIALTRLALPGTQIKRYIDDAECMQALLSGQVNAVAVPRITANSIIKKRHLQNKFAVKFDFYDQPNSMAVAPGHFQLLQWLNDFIYNVKHNGQLNAINKKWLGGPLPNLPVF